MLGALVLVASLNVAATLQAPTISTLVSRAVALPIEAAEAVALPIEAAEADGAWLVPGALMLGEEVSSADALVAAGIDCYVSRAEADAPPPSFLADAAGIRCANCVFDTPRDVEPLLSLLGTCVSHYEGGGRAVYVTNPVVAACLLSLLREDADGAAIDALRTQGQRRFVKSIVKSIRTHRRLLRDQAMAAAGMPRGYL